MRLSKYNTEDIIRNLRTFSYTTKEDGETVTKNVTLFSDAQAPLVNRFFLQYKGSLKADDIMDAYKDGDISASDLASMVLLMTKSQLVNLWRIWEADYNPLWNVDGVEKKEIKTEFGKIVDREKNSSTTDEQLTDGKNNVTHGRKLTDDQKSDGKNNVTHGHTLTDNQTADGKQNTTHGLKTTISEPTTTDGVSAFDSGSNFENKAQTSATTHDNEESGTTNIALSMGTVLHTEGGTTNTAISMGTIEHEESGTTNTALSIGKIKHSNDGKDTDKESGDETTTETYTRSGNIGVTMSTQLLRDGDNFWSQFSFFEKYFELIAEPLTIPIYDDEED